MKIKELQKKYNLQKSDFWELPQNGTWILKHDAIEKIKTIENIQLDDWQVLNSETDLCRFLITMSMDDEGVKRVVQTIGEADRKNCKANYLGSMAEKRAIDRAVLKLIRAYEYGIYSDSESDDFKKPAYTITEKQKEKYQELLNSGAYDGEKQKMNNWWKDLTTEIQAEKGLKRMQEIVDKYLQKKVKGVA
tara:strand:- start:3176 stop:3748 length:573 start_codon:yes stop_codon:yes gene_type:complete